MESILYIFIVLGISKSIFALVDSFDIEAFKKAKERNLNKKLRSYDNRT